MWFVSQHISVFQDYLLLTTGYTGVNKNTVEISVTSVNPYSAGIDFSRQNLTYVVWLLKSIPCTVRVEIFLMDLTP